ncbi:hypothetical protein GCM10010166_27060 [Couchioplanes caeruleus subsp. azureus]|nr:hypothetical protein GCM10010166_27060 [Couchioplanes caeruleus subsp. azureus]
MCGKLSSGSTTHIAELLRSGQHPRRRCLRHYRLAAEHRRGSTDRDLRTACDIDQPRSDRCHLALGRAVSAEHVAQAMAGAGLGAYPAEMIGQERTWSNT